jgi:hypothetical protein
MSADAKLAAFRRIVAESQHGKVEGCRIDLFSASAVLAVYDKLSPTNQAQYLTKPAPIMVLIAFRLLKKAEVVS